LTKKKEKEKEKEKKKKRREEEKLKPPKPQKNEVQRKTDRGICQQKALRKEKEKRKERKKRKKRKNSNPQNLKSVKFKGRQTHRGVEVICTSLPRVIFPFSLPLFPRMNLSLVPLYSDPSLKWERGKNNVGTTL